MSRRRWVSLATDPAPVYAAWAPVAARVWRELGYRSFLHLHDEGPQWARPFGQLILAELEDAGALATPIATAPPLSMANTMRAARLFAHLAKCMRADDFILTADVDMIPLDAAFFDRSEDFVVLRPLYQRWLASGGDGPTLTDEDLAQGSPHIRFPMCYTGALATIWRELMPESLEELVAGLDRDHHTIDEERMTAAILRSPRSQGRLCEVDCLSRWTRGELHLVEPDGAPLLSCYRDMPRGLLRLGDLWRPDQGTPIPDGAVDFIPPRFTGTTREEHPWWAFDVVRLRYPQLDRWLDGYRTKLWGSGF